MRSFCNQDAFLKQQGFNLLELLIVLGLIALTFGVLMPSGQSMLEQSRLISATNDSYSALLHTRNEATRLKIDSTLCFIASSEATDCAYQSSGLLGVFSEKNQAQSLVKNYEISEQISLTFKGTNDNKIKFATIGNRQPTDGTDVYLEIKTENLSKEIEVCFNGRVFIREKLGVSECR